MAIGQTLAIAISGVKANALRANVAANNIVNASTPDFKSSQVRTTSLVTSPLEPGGGVLAQLIGGGDVDVATEFIRLIEADIAYRANIKTIETVEGIETEVIDILA